MKVPFKKLHKVDSIVIARIAAELASKCNRKSDPHCSSPLQRTSGGLTMGSDDSGAQAEATRLFCSTEGRIRRDKTRRRIWFMGSRMSGVVWIPVGKEVHPAEVAGAAVRNYETHIRALCCLRS
jgi:hypothetical protein